MKRWALLLALILLGPATPGRAAVSFVSAVAMSSTAANTAFTLAFTVDSSANRFLGVFIATSGSTATLSTATWNGTSLTSPLSGAANGGTLHEYFAYLANPTNATANVVVNLAAAPSSCFGMIACEYAGVDPFAPYDVGTATSGSSTTLLGFLTSTFASDQFLDAPFLLGSGTLTNDGTLTQRVTIAPNNVSNIFRLNDKALTTAQYYAISNTASVSNPWDQLVVAIKQVQPTATPTFTATPSWTPTPTATATATATPTNTPVIASLVNWH